MTQINSKIYLLTLIISFTIICSMNVRKENPILLQEKTKTLSESAAQKLMKKFQPTVYLSPDEKYFPTKIEDFGINWKTATLGNKAATVSFTNTGPKSFDNSVPVYSSILEDTTTGTLRITYAFLFGFNGCGPKVNVYMKILGIKYINNHAYSVCPADKHWGDLEHIEVHLKSDYSTIDHLVYAYHQWTKTLTSSEVSYTGTSPIVYLGNGSHASYSTPGTQSYHNIYYHHDGKSSTKISLDLHDYCATSTTETGAHKWKSSNPRLLKLNGVSTTDISYDEEYLSSLYIGKLGPQYYDATTSDYVETLDEMAKYAGYVSSSLKKDFKSAASTINEYFEAGAPGNLASKSWW